MLFVVVIRVVAFIVVLSLLVLMVLVPPLLGQLALHYHLCKSYYFHLYII
jgi:hypothetical protein